MSDYIAGELRHYWWKVFPMDDTVMHSFDDLENTCWLVPDDTVHLIHTPPLFGTWVILILDIAIDSYSTTRFLLFLYFSKGKPSAGETPGGTLHAPNVR